MRHRHRLALATALALIAASVGAASAAAQGACLPREEAVAKLEQHYGEEKIGLGIGPGGNAVFELFVAETGTWTFTVTRPDGLSCIVASGHSWGAVPAMPGEPL